MTYKGEGNGEHRTTPLQARLRSERIPALLGKLALDRRLHGRALGGRLQFDAYQRVLADTRAVGARYLVVEAIDDEAVRFCEHYGFVHAPGGPSIRMVRKISGYPSRRRGSTVNKPLPNRLRAK